MNPYLFLAIGLLLIFLEFFVPGAVMGAIGALFVMGSIVIFAMEASSPLWVILYIALIGIMLVYLFKFAIWRIRKAKPLYSIYSDSAQDGYVASTFDKTAIGKKGIVSSDLKPGGYILVDGKQNQAISVSGYIEKGKEVDVIDGQEESLIVKIHTSNKSL